MDDVFSTGSMETMEVPRGNCQYFEHADEELNTAQPLETHDIVVLFKERASQVVRKKTKVSAVRFGRSTKSDVAGLEDQKGSITFKNEKYIKALNLILNVFILD